jgi:glutaredoxin
MKRVTVYTKPECSLCGDVLAVLERVRLKTPFALEEVDISADFRLRRLYRERIPVVAIDGVEAFDYVVDEHELERLLALPDPTPASSTNGA